MARCRRRIVVTSRNDSIDRIVQSLYDQCRSDPGGCPMFETDSFIAACVEAAGEHEPRLAVRDVLERGMADPASVARALPPERAGITKLHVSPEITILHVVWAPGMSFGPHDHRMWAAIGIYTRGEDNSFYLRHHVTL